MQDNKMIALAEAIDRLPEKHKRYIEMVKNGYDAAHAERILNVPGAAVRGLLARICTNLSLPLSAIYDPQGDSTMAFPAGFPTTEYFKLPEGPARHALKKKWGFNKQSTIPKGFPVKEYEALDFDGKNALREQWWIKPLPGKVSVKPLAANGSAPGKPKGDWSKAKEQMESIFPRTTDGAVKFIRAWNKAVDGNTFVAEHGNANPEFWSAATHRAVFLRKKGVDLKVLKKTRGEEVLYDWDLLKQVAAEGA